MIDPVTAVGLATSAFNILKQGISAGKDIQEMSGTLAKWGSAFSDFQYAEDKTKTDNMLMEIGTKYILGRTGGMLPYNQFKEYRPDVSKGEYNSYKAFKWDKNLDLDIIILAILTPFMIIEPPDVIKKKRRRTLI